MKILAVILLFILSVIIFLIAEILRIQHRRWGIMGETWICMTAYICLALVALGLVVSGGYLILS